MARRLVVEVLSDASKFDKGIDQADRKIKGFEDSTKRADSTTARFTGKLDAAATAFKGIAVAAAGAAILKFAKDSTQAAVNLGESINAVEKTFGTASDTVLDFGEAAASSAGLSARAFNELATPIGALLQNFGFSAQSAADATVELAQRGADLASVFNVDVSEALGAIGAALRGEGDPIERFGVNVSAARVEAFALAEGLAASKSEITDQIKVQARLGLILQDSARFAGDFADTAGQAANATKTLAAETENFQAAFGTFLVGPATGGIRTLSRTIDLLGTTLNFIRNPLDEVQRSINQIPVSVNRLRREVGGFEGQEGAAFLTILSEIPVQALDSVEYLEQLADAIGLTSDELGDILRDKSVEELADILGITTDEAQGLRDALVEVNQSLESPAGTAAYAARLQGLAEAYGEAAREAGAAAAANSLLVDSLAAGASLLQEQASPLLAAARSRQRLTAAEEALAEAQKRGSDADIASARLDLVEATAEADIAQANFAASFEESIDAVSKIAGETEQDILSLLETLGVLDEFGDIEFFIRARLELIDRSAAGIGGAAAFIREQDRNGPLGSITNNVTINAPNSDASTIEDAALRGIVEGIDRFNRGVVGQ